MSIQRTQRTIYSTRRIDGKTRSLRNSHTRLPPPHSLLEYFCHNNIITHAKSQRTVGFFPDTLRFLSAKLFPLSCFRYFRLSGVLPLLSQRNFDLRERSRGLLKVIFDFREHSRAFAGAFSGFGKTPEVSLDVFSIFRSTPETSLAHFRALGVFFVSKFNRKHTEGGHAWQQ